MAVNLLEKYGQNQSVSGGVNLLERYSDTQTQESDPMETARSQIKEQFPGMPDFLREGILKTVGTEKHPALEQAGQAAEPFISAVEGAGLPAASRGLLSGLTAPERFAGKFVPGEVGKKMQAPLPEAPQGDFPQLSQTLEMLGDIGGATASGGAIFKGLTGGAEAMGIPGILSSPVAGAATGAAISPEYPAAGALLGAAAPAATRTAQTVFEDLPQAAKTIFQKQEPAKAFEKMLSKHDVLDRTASELYGAADQMAASRDLQPLKIKDNIFELSEKHLPKTDEVNDMLQRAQTGDYKALSELQSDMGKESVSILTNPNASQAERNAARELMSARKKLNKSMDEQLIQQGHTDLASVRKQASDIYADKMQTYFNKNLKPTVRNIFKEGKRLQPGQTDMDLIKPFMERSDTMEEFLSKHPELQEEVQLARSKREAIDKLKPVGKAVKSSGTGGGILKLADLLSDIF